jgi:hypothetical protein
MERKRRAYIEWQALPPPSNGMKLKFSEFFQEKEQKFLRNKIFGKGGISRRRRRPSRKYKKSKRVFRKKSRSTRRR